MQNNKDTASKAYDLRLQTNKSTEAVRTKSESDATESKNAENIGEVKVYKEKNIVKKAKNNTKMSNNDLSELVRLLSLQIKNEEDKNNKTIITVDTFAKILNDFDGENVPVDKWFENFEQNAEAYELNDKQKYVQARNKISGVAKMFLETVNVSNYEMLKNTLINEFGKNYDSGEIHKMLHEKSKTKSESFHEYVITMRKIAALGNIEDRAIIRYIVDGIGGKNIFKQQLYASKDFKQLRENFEIYESLYKKNEGHARAWQRPNEVKVKVDQYHCFNCGSKDHKLKDCKNGQKCFKCNAFGHISKNCAKNNVSRKDMNIIMTNERFKIIKFNGKNINCLVDTGADVSVIKESVCRSNFPSRTLQDCKAVLYGFGSKKTNPIGSVSGKLYVDEVEKDHCFLVVKDGSLKVDAILGFDFTKDFILTYNDGYKFENKQKDLSNKHLQLYNINMCEIDVDEKYREQVEDMIKNYKPVSQIEESPVCMKIVPNNDMKPFRHAPARLPLNEENAVNEQIEEWLRNGIIRKSYSDVASRLVVVKKKCGAYRVCVDFRQLNSMVLKDCFPVPVIEDVLAKLNDAKYFITLDLENGFFHIPIEETSKKYTAFVTKHGFFEFNKAPFGFCNSPANFVRFINYIFQDMINKDVLELYVDDIVIYAKTPEECLQKLQLVFDQAARFDLRFKWVKCVFLKTRINFLGHVIENGKIWPGEEKTKAVRKFPMPKNIKDIQSFLGLTGYFRKFVQGYSLIAKPLTELLKKDVVFKIEAEQQEAINQLKQILTNEPVLRIFNREAETELHTDASRLGFGAALMQKSDGKMHPIYFWSKKASVQESQLHSYVLEVKAAFLAMKKFRQYILGIKFKLITDCAAFKQTISKKDVPRSVAQWIIFLQEFNFTVEHRGGNRMRHVDSLSRYPVGVMIISTELTARLTKQQSEDDYIKTIKYALSLGPYENFKEKGALIYKTEKGNDLLLVPKLMETEIIKNIHERGHYGVEKTRHEVQQQFYIPHLEGKIRRIIDNCIRCIIHNKKLGKKEGMLSVIDKGDVPLHTLHVDHLGPMDATTKQYKHIFSMVDGFTKFVWLFPTKTTNADEVIRHLTTWSDIFGFPTRIISDKGPAFTSDRFKKFCEENNIEHVVTTTGVPRGNGQIERVNRCIISIISKLSSNDATKWYKHVGEVQKAINSHVHSSTKVTPFQLLVGVKMKTGVYDNILQMLEDELIQRFDEERQQSRNEAKIQIQNAQKRYKENFDRHRKKADSYQVGDLVAIKRTQFVAGKKLAQEYLGPYKVDKMRSNNRYQVVKVADIEGPNKTSTSNDMMKPWKQMEAGYLSSETDESQDGRM